MTGRKSGSRASRQGLPESPDTQTVELPIASRKVRMTGKALAF
jgi:hypothetical protein